MFPKKFPITKLGQGKNVKRDRLTSQHVENDAKTISEVLC